METTPVAKQLFALIRGEFSTDDAQEILVNLINKKIKFHQLQDFSHQERFGQPDEKSANRIKELRKTQAAILVVIQKAKARGKSLRISSDIQLEITE